MLDVAHGDVAEEGLDVPLGDSQDILGPVMVFGIPDEAAEIFGIELDGTGAFPLSQLGEDECADQGPEGSPRLAYYGW